MDPSITQQISLLISVGDLNLSTFKVFGEPRRRKTSTALRPRSEDPRSTFSVALSSREVPSSHLCLGFRGWRVVTDGRRRMSTWAWSGRSGPGDLSGGEHRLAYNGSRPVSPLTTKTVGNIDLF
jgi:hypothetical protein